MTFLTTALSFILAPFLLIGTSLGTALAPEQEPMLGATEAIPTTIAFFETSLASNISDSATSFTLTSATDKDGTLLASSTYAFVIDEGSSNEEIVMADCTGTACTNVERGISVRTGNTEVTALKKSHRRGASVKMTDAPILMILSSIANGIQDVPNTLTYDGAETIATSSNDVVYASWVNSNYGDLFNGNTWASDQYVTNALYGSSTAQFTGTTTGYAGFLTSASGQCHMGSVNTQLCDKAYIDGVAVAGASDANETTKGIVEEATLTEVLTGVAAGGTGANLFVAPDKLESAVSVNGTTTIGMYGVATTTFTIEAGQRYVIFAGFGCSYIAATGRDVNGYLYVDDKLVRQLTGIGSEGDNIGAAMPFFFTYASSSPNETTVDILPTANCTIESPFIDWIILP